MSWAARDAGAVRLDQFDGRLDHLAGHTPIWEDAETALRQRLGLRLDDPG